MSDAPVKVSPVEKFKAASDFLRGEIAAELAEDTPKFGKSSIQLLKHHGAYQQAYKNAEGKKFFSVMLRTAVPGGRITPAQLLAHLDLCDELGDGSVRLTTRQAIQLHGLLKSNLRQTIQRIHQVHLSTLAACGDVVRNVMCSPVPYKNNSVYTQMQTMTDEIVAAMLPKTSAYYELWLRDEETGRKEIVAGGQPKEIEPLYGPTYLPRKFKIGVGIPEDNSADIYSQDAGLLGILEGDQIVGYNLVVGGGFGKTPTSDKTFAAVGSPFCYATPSEVIPILHAIIKVQRDFGNRADRKTARLKYLIKNWGFDKFREKVSEYLGADLTPAKLVTVTDYHDGMGWNPQGDGLWFYGLNIENGRIKDTASSQLKSALRELCTTFNVPMRITPHQSLIFCDLKENEKEQLEAILLRHQVRLSEQFSNTRRWAIACPALPTCGLAVTESENVLPSILDALEAALAQLGLADEVFTTRMTGCPNGCARPYNSDIGLVGKVRDKYTLYLGGTRLGDRLNFIYKEMVPTEEIVPQLTSVFKFFKEARTEGETFGDFCDRLGLEKLRATCDLSAGE